MLKRFTKYFPYNRSVCKFQGKVKKLGGEERRKRKSQKFCHHLKKKKNQKTSHKTQTQNQKIITKREKMNKLSNSLIGLLNLLTLLGSIPIIGGALWMARNSTTCEAFLQRPLLVVGFLVLLISLAGFVGACFDVAWALWLYLFVMLLLIATLLGLTIFGIGVASGGGGEHRVGDYSAWLRNRVNNPQYWITIRSCILGSNTCNQASNSLSPLNYLQRDITPIQVLFSFNF